MKQTDCQQLRKNLEALKNQKADFDAEFEIGKEKRDFAESKKMQKEMEALIQKIEDMLAVSIERAKEILGEKDCLGPDAVKKAFGIELKPEEVPDIPFKEEELERAKELGQFLVLRTNKAPDGEDLTMKKMNDMLANEFKKNNKGKILYDTDWYKDEDFFTKETPVSAPSTALRATTGRANLEWALVTKEVIPNSTSKNYLQQTEKLVEYLTNDVFKNQEMPAEYAEAIKEFNKQKTAIAALVKETGNDEKQKQAAEMLENLEINQLTRQTPAEALYDLSMYYQNNDERLLKNIYTWTARRSSAGWLVDIGDFDADGADVNRWNPDVSDDDLCVSFARSH